MTPKASWIHAAAAKSIDPPGVEGALLGLEKVWPEKALPLRELVSGFPLGEQNLLHLLAVSDVSASRLQTDPEILLWLNRREVTMAPRSYGEMMRDLHATSDHAIAADGFRALRLWKGREMVRIAAREVANAARLEQTTAELSQIAEICIRSVYEHWNAEFRNKFGSPKSEFAILALGKLGGHELNYSSDVDLIFLYDEEGELTPRLSYHEFFNRLGKRILQTFSAPSTEGLFLRIDLRLRPEGSAGPIARSLESMEHYYGGFGETWERLALIKARGIAGSRETAYDFLRQHQPFIYPRNPTPDLLEEIARIKRRIERDVLGADDLHRNVKLGHGGIREIEFVVQTLQFMHGARHAFLQETSTLKALRGLAELELIPRSEIVDLDRAYRFLRSTEHRLQIRAEQQTHTVPEDETELKQLARSLGFESGENFLSELAKETTAVRAIFNRIIADAPDAAKDTASYSFFSNPAQAEKNIRAGLEGFEKRHVSARTRQVYSRLQPALLAQLRIVADPDATLTQFVRFVDAYGMRSSLFELLVTNPKLLELLVRLLDLSRFGGDLLIKRPQFLEELTRDERLSRSISTTEHLERLQTVAGHDESLEELRGYRQRQLLRILLRDILGWSKRAELYQEHSALAEACLVFATRLLGNNDLTIIAMGKFGGNELTYGADLDILFVGEEAATAQRLVAGFSAPSGQGNLPRIDPRLRPEGEKGPLTVGVDTYASYFQGRAQFWELQALTRARPVVGREQNEFMEVARSAWIQAAGDPQLATNVDSMLERIRRDRGGGSDFHELKTGRGGIVEAEFLVQMLQMKSKLWEPNWTAAVHALEENSNLTNQEAKDLESAYSFLRDCETALRRQENTAVSSLPKDPQEELRLARRLDLPDLDVFRKEYESARAVIHRIYESKMRSS